MYTFGYLAFCYKLITGYSAAKGSRWQDSDQPAHLRGLFSLRWALNGEPRAKRDFKWKTKSANQN